MGYKQMITEARQEGRANEATMWASIEAVDEMLEELKEKHPEKYWHFYAQGTSPAQWQPL